MQNGGRAVLQVYVHLMGFSTLLLRIAIGKYGLFPFYAFVYKQVPKNQEHVKYACQGYLRIDFSSPVSLKYIWGIFMAL